MSKPLLEGSNARLIGRTQYEADREIASILLGALQNSKKGNRDAVEKAIIDALTVNEERARIDYLLSQGRHREALDEVIAARGIELHSGKTG